MKFDEFLLENELSLLSRWTDAVLSTWPAEARPFLEGKDRFANPLGYNITQGLRQVYRNLRGEDNDAGAFLEQIMKIMAVQDRTPAEGVSFLFALKGLVREAAAGQEDGAGFAAWCDRVDAMALRAFDLYSQSRERLFAARIREIQSGNHLLTRHGCPSALLDADGGGPRRIG